MKLGGETKRNEGDCFNLFSTLHYRNGQFWPQGVVQIDNDSMMNVAPTKQRQQ